MHCIRSFIPPQPFLFYLFLIVIFEYFHIQFYFLSLIFVVFFSFCHFSPTAAQLTGHRFGFNAKWLEVDAPEIHTAARFTSIRVINTFRVSALHRQPHADKILFQFCHITSSRIHHTRVMSHCSSECSVCIKHTLCFAFYRSLVFVWLVPLRGVRHSVYSFDMWYRMMWSWCYLNRTRCLFRLRDSDDWKIWIFHWSRCNFQSELSEKSFWAMW